MKRHLVEQSEKLLAAARERKLKLATAESCTGGLIAAALTEIPGSSDVFERGFVTYSNEAKIDLLGVAKELIARHGAVSEAAVEAMALGALENSRAHLALAVSGIAGPEGGSADKPVGTVFFALARDERPVKIVRKNFSPDLDRSDIRAQAAAFGLDMLMEAVEPHILA
ncbi:nicotinamide-nucleotide amidohydrolase family protein [Rhodoblastus acidophilus]|uniref:Nicotinamide-nucleotide amidohydrolase family protein n=1 Tax=Rhodoblastus acidophilus TaxID=1074 RepID=A0A6N8DKT9_RHOAC|nr:CinA family protein [Rhodoblastus acidophilus]MCW2274347.1 nicotinamide-nucleotide amidase [Rhodoblastus acidophilus]MTV31200.1 nicotinamide-nucleotide amidohydrolase family protein [Rhodoblastus acidophilus]